MKASEKLIREVRDTLADCIESLRVADQELYKKDGPLKDDSRQRLIARAVQALEAVRALATLIRLGY